MDAEKEKDNSILKLFHSELLKQVTEYKQLLENLTANSNHDVLDSLSRIAHSIKGAAKLVNQKVVEKVADSLEAYFKARMGKDFLTDSHQEVLLNKSLHLFDEIANSPFEQFLIIIDTFTQPLSNISEQLEEVVTKSTEERNIESESLEKSSKQMGVQEALLLLKELSKNLNSSLIKIKNDFNDTQVLDDMHLDAAKVKIIGESSSLKILLLIGDALESCFQAALSKQLTWTQGHMDLIIESIDFLSRLSQIDANSIDFWLEKQEKGAEAIACVLQAISREAASIPSNTSSQEIEEAKPTVSSNQKLPIDESMFELFYIEVDQRIRELNEGILQLESNTDDPSILEGLMRAAHSIKGAARIIDLSLISRLAHALEDFFVHLQKKNNSATTDGIDLLLRGVDFFQCMIQVSIDSIDDWLRSQTSAIDQYIDDISYAMGEEKEKKELPKKVPSEQPKPRALNPSDSKKVAPVSKSPPLERKKDPFLRVSSNNLNRLMGLAGESLVESRWLTPFSESLLLLKRIQNKLALELDTLSDRITPHQLDEKTKVLLGSMKKELASCQINLAEKITELELYTQRQISLSDRLYKQVISTRMRPFSDGCEHFPRLVRDIAKQLNKKVHIVIEGKNTPVDREILEKLEAPLNHLLRNAIDHGIETPEERLSKGKQETGKVKVEASHRAGMLSITVSDDGRGIESEQMRKIVAKKGLVNEEMAKKLNMSELLEFMFLPGFSTSHEVTDLSGRGVGLSVVQTMVQEVGGTLKAQSDHGLSFHLQMPLTLSVIRALLVEIAGEPYAFPLARLAHLLFLPKEKIQTVEHRQYFFDGKKNIGLIPAYQILELKPTKNYSDYVPVIIINDQMNDYGVIIDKFIGEKELVVQELDPVLGKIPDISGGAFLENGSPILIVDVEDMVRSIDKQLSKGDFDEVQFNQSDQTIITEQKKVLVVDDSITVREVESRLLKNAGFDVDTAINGADGWNAIRVGHYDLVITDIDMPRMNGIEFVRAIRSDDKLKNVPIIIVSYKERENDRKVGLEAGANVYLTKSSFHDETLLSVVSDLIGKSKVTKVKEKSL